MLTTPRTAALKNPPWSPAKQTNTIEIEANKKVCTSFSATKKPATNPRIASKLVSVLVTDSVGPRKIIMAATITARMIEIRKA